MAYKVLRDGNGSSVINVVGLGCYAPLHEFEDMAAELAALKEQMRWRDVRVELPKQSEHSNYSKCVIAHVESNKCDFTAVYDHEVTNAWSCFFSGKVIRGVARWMPLPKPPKEQE